MRSQHHRTVGRGTPDVTDRCEAAVGSRSPADLTRLLDDPSPWVARAAIGRLTEIDGRVAARELRARLLKCDLCLVADVAGALRHLGAGDACDVAITGLGEDPYTRRLAAARALGVFGDVRAVAPLRAALRDDIAGVRIAALEALAQLDRAEAAVDDCARLLADRDPHVRIAAVRAIRRVTHQPGEIIAIVAGDDDRLVRLAVADALHTLPDPAATALLSDPDLRVREAAARSAGIRQSQLLGQLLSHDPSSDVRHAAARTLGNLQDPQLAETLILGVEDVDAVVRVAVLRALEQLLTHGGAITRLQHELVSARPERRRATVYALAHLKGLEAASELWRLADDPDVPTRLALLQTAEALQPDPEPLLRYLATDPDSTVRLSAENRLLRRDSARA